MATRDGTLNKIVSAFVASRIDDAIVSATGGNTFCCPVPDTPDYPPCDVCGKEFEGKLRCSKCQCVFYCGHECQKADWKKNHKKDCATMAKNCKDAASAFVNAVTFYTNLTLNFDDADTINDDAVLLQNIHLMPALNNVLDNNMWRSLHNAGAYKYAIDIDINGAIESLFKDDIRIAGKYETGCCFSDKVMTELFRGGRNIPGPMMIEIDAYRIKKYVRSSPTAFETWLQSSFHIIHKFQTRAVKAAQNNDSKFLAIQNSARKIAGAWGLVFASPKASKAILLGPSRVADEAAIDRAKWILQQISKIIHQFPEDIPGICSGITGLFDTFTAMFELRLQEFGIEVGDFQKVIGFKGDESLQLRYNTCAVPVAVATIAKGKALNLSEMREALRKHGETRFGISRGSSGDSAVSGGGKKDSRKRGKKGRRN